MKKNFSAISGFPGRTAFLGITLLMGSCQQNDYSYTLKTIYETTARSLIAVDINSDGTDEIIECIGPWAYIKNQQGFLLRQITFTTSSFYPIGAFDLDKKPPLDLVFYYRSDTMIYLSIVYNADSMVNRLVVQGRDIHPATIAKYDCDIFNAQAMDVNNDGYNDLLLQISTGYDLYPRGLMAYDARAGQELWHHWIGCSPGPQPPMVYDLDNDGQKEIIFGTASSNNGGNLNGIDDYHSWLVALNNQGHRLWQTKIGGRTTNVKFWISEPDHDRSITIIACAVSGLAETEDTNLIALIDPAAGKITKYLKVGQRYLGFAVYDYNRDGKTEILTGNHDGKLRIFNLQLELLADQQMEPMTELTAVQDINQDGYQELMLTDGSGKITVLNEHLRPILVFSTGFGRIDYFKIARDQDRCRLIAQTQISQDQVQSRLYELTISLKPYLNPLILAFLASVILLIMLGLILHQHYRFRRLVRYFFNQAPMGMLVLDKHNRPLFRNERFYSLVGGEKKNIDRLLAYPDLKKHLSVSAAAANFNLAWSGKNLEIMIYRLGTRKLVVVLDRTSERESRSLISWSVIAQRLAHEIKNPLSTIKLAVQRIRDVQHPSSSRQARKAEQYLQIIDDETERLRETTNKFMRILTLGKMDLRVHDLNEILGKVLQSYRGKIPQKVKITKNFYQPLPRITCDGDQISMLFTILLDNALQAVNETGELILRTNLVEIVDPDAALNHICPCVEITIEDTGPGMPTEVMDRLFQPVNSAKTGGTGIGLVIAHRIVEEHHGKITINSTQGVGTVVQVLIPVKDLKLIAS